MAKKLYTFTDTLFDTAATFILIPQFLFFVFRYTMVEYHEGGRYTNLHSYVCLVTMFLFSYSLIRLMITYLQPLRESFWEKEVDASLKSRLRFLFTRWEFWIKALIIACIYLALPLNWTLKPLAVVTGADSFADKLLCLAGLLPALLAIAVLAHLSAYKQWGRNKNPAAYGKKEYNRKVLLVGMIYTGGAMVFVMMFPVFLPLFKMLYGALTVGWVAAIAVLVSLPFVFRFLRAIIKRRSFLRRLNKLCAEKGYAVSEIQKLYLSLFRFLDGESFTLTMGEKRYSCKLLSARKRSVPLAISADGTLTFIHIIHIRKAELFRYTTTYKFGYESENPKILVVNPTPQRAFCTRQSLTCWTNRSERREYSD